MEAVERKIEKSDYEKIMDRMLETLKNYSAINANAIKVSKEKALIMLNTTDVKVADNIADIVELISSIDNVVDAVHSSFKTMVNSIEKFGTGNVSDALLLYIEDRLNIIDKMSNLLEIKSSFDYEKIAEAEKKLGGKIK